MRGPAPFLLAAACFTLALGLPFGRAAAAYTSSPTVRLSPRLVQDEGHLFLGRGGTTWALPGELRMELVPFVVPGRTYATPGAPPGRSHPARLPLVGLLAVALLASRGRRVRFARAATLGGAALLVLTGLLPAVPSAGASVAVFGLAFLGMGLRAPRATPPAGV